MSISAPALHLPRPPRSKRLPPPPTADELSIRPELHDLYGRLKQISAARKLQFALRQYLAAGPIRGGEAALCHDLAASLRRGLALESDRAVAEQP